MAITLNVYIGPIGNVQVEPEVHITQKLGLQ